jgi:transketolase
MRQAVIDTIYDHMKQNENSFFLTGDLGYNTLETIQKDFPSRFINVGIAEQNMIGIAAGLAKAGNKVFVYSIIPFLTMRCFEQIRNDLCYHNCDVVLLGTGAGLSYGILGSTHFALEDVAVMTALPNMVVFSPCDEMEAVLGIKELLNNYHGPVYFRIGKKKEPTVYENAFPLKIGQGVVIMEGKDTTIFANGSLVSESLLAVEALKKDGIAAALVDIHTLKPIDKHLILKFCQNKKVVFSVEEHSIFGGLGTAVAQVIAEAGLGTKLLRIGTDGNFVKLVGSQAYLREKLGFNAKGIAEKIKSFIL